MPLSNTPKLSAGDTDNRSVPPRWGKHRGQFAGNPRPTAAQPFDLDFRRPLRQRSHGGPRVAAASSRCAHGSCGGGDGPGTVGVDDEDGLMSRLVGVGETPTPRPRDVIGKSPPSGENSEDNLQETHGQPLPNHLTLISADLCGCGFHRSPRGPQAVPSVQGVIPHSPKSPHSPIHGIMPHESVSPRHSAQSPISPIGPRRHHGPSYYQWLTDSRHRV